MSRCRDIIFDIPANKPFTGCDGKPYSDAYLREQLKRAEDNENYEYCQKVKEELLRRKAKSGCVL